MKRLAVTLVNSLIVLTAIAPIVGTPRVVAATADIVQAIGVAIEVAELAEQLDSGQ